MEEKFNQLKVYFEHNPHYAYLLLAVVFGVLAIGVFKNKNWAIDPANSTQKFNYQIFGHNTFRIVKGGAFVLGFLAGLYGFFSNLK